MAGSDTAVDFVTGAPGPGSLDVAWRHGVRTRWQRSEPPLQVHRYDEHTLVLRQSKAVNYEAPFVFLLFGNDRALLLDTGATGDPLLCPLRATVDGLIDDWLAAHPRADHAADYALVVAHTHAHGDHVAGDVQFADRPATTVVPKEAAAVRDFFGFGGSWPTGRVTFDLGGRVLDVLGSPGHHDSAVTFHDRWSGILFTGDTVLPGRLYAADFPAFLATLDRLVEFAEAHRVTHVLGCHVEMHRRPGRDFPLGATFQPGERAPGMTPAQLVAVRDAARSVAGKPGVHRFDDFVIYHEPGKRETRRLLTRARVRKAMAAPLRS
ncbi:Metallo-beta-lactamase superfamily protein [Actinacidiphila yanglinensis]|uniref:Metallo-beta-lactamase superfamily protein n=1 Tax=Actinacidiphila yanglinensis TaxID=310779 RepID=A0A1H5YSX8_9ACTN|nr:MBL fold metallo-hydrolase [Actinacidiphila yanglinensis]SEG27251.1 Metallo-beta-lactamase superfamily protein [Actinacidiphila yanglinensis]